MTPHPFAAPALEAMNHLLPAFDFTALIASNQASAVYLAKQRSLDRDVAIKILAPQAGGKQGFIDSFQRTARTMGRLNHPNLIGVYDSGMVDQMLYFVMEFVPGKSLERSASGQKIEFATATRIIEAISDGLSHAHAHGIIHGNLDPSNILLNQKAEPKIGNFGFSHASGTALAADGSAANASFRAPEVLADPSNASEQSDIFSVGAILYQLLTGTPLTPDAKPPSTICACDSGIDAICSQATHPYTSRRYPDMRSFRVALSNSLKHARPAIATGTPGSLRLAVSAKPPESQRLGARAAIPGAAPPPTTSSQKTHQVGKDWKLIRNLFIIAGLLYAISLAWDNYKKTSTRREKENRETIARIEANKQKAIEEARLKILSNNSKPPVPDNPGLPGITPPKPLPAGESPADSLARLRNSLAAGDRDEMPVGSVRQGDCDYFLVTASMSWPEAFTFAENHGGHLVIPKAGADVTWLVKNVTTGSGVWIGAARSGRTEWTLVDGLAWKPNKEPGGTGFYLSIDNHGMLRAEGAKAKLPFVIQWHRNGKNPGSLQALLTTTRESFGKSRPVYPPGTQVIDNRNYLYVARPAMWREAVDLAESSGGHLAVTSETGEISRISELTKDMPAPDGIWLGAFRKGDQWLWITGEPWKSANWANESTSDTPDSALIISPGKGWKSMGLSEQASGFIIEWSNDRKSSANNPNPGSAGPNTGSANPNAEVAALSVRARELVAAADRKRTERLATNARKLASDLDIFLRGSSKSDQAIWGNHVILLKSAVVNNRVPASVPLSSGIRLSKKMAELAQASALKQDQIDADFVTEVERIQTAFLSKVREAATKARESGQRALAESLNDTLDGAANIESWVRSFGFEAKPQNPVPADVGTGNRSGLKIPGFNGGNQPPMIE
jgi:serine/threonine protein kinase